MDKKPDEKNNDPFKEMRDNLTKRINEKYIEANALIDAIEQSYKESQEENHHTVEQTEIEEESFDELDDIRRLQIKYKIPSKVKLEEKVEENNDVKIEKPGFWGRIGRKIALSLLLPATLYMGSFLGISDTGKIAGRVANEQRGNGWYQIALENNDKIRFHNNNFDLDKVDERIDAGDLVSLIGTKVSGGEYDWKAEGIDATKVDALIDIINNKGFFDELFSDSLSAWDIYYEARFLFHGTKDSYLPWTTDKNKIKEGIKKLEEAITKTESRYRERFWNVLSDAYAKLGDYEEAVKAFEKDIEMDSDVWAHQWNKLGELYLKAGKTEKAIESLKKAVELDGDYQWWLDKLLDEIDEDN